MTDGIAEHRSTLQTIEQQEIERAFREVIATPHGKRLLYWMLEQCAIYRDAYTGEPASTNYMLGQQSSGRKLIAKLDEINPKFYPQLLIDISEIRLRDRAQAEAIDNPEDDDDDEYA